MMAVLMAVAVAMAPATIATHALLRGQTIGAGDVEVVARPVAEARGTVDLAQAIGMAPRRALPAGTVLRPGDLGPPPLVTRGDSVTIEIVRGALRIAASGRALDTGSAGAMVRVQSAATSKMLAAVVSGPGTVRVAVP
jgi:flagella basal body P-ring formation protein FlgA